MGKCCVLAMTVWADMCPMPRMPNLPRVATHRTETEEVELPNGYKAVFEYTITRNSDDPERWSTGYESAVSIVRGGVVLHRIDDVLTTGRSGLWLPSTNKDEEPLLRSVDQDITGNGIPNLVVREFSGGAHCCTTTYIFELGKERFVAFEPISQGHSTGRQSFVQADDDPALEISIRDWRFAYWKMSYAESPAPDVLLDFREIRDRQAAWVFANNKKTLTEAERKTLTAHAEALGRSKRAPTEFPQFPKFLANVLELIYAGNADFARKYTQMGFRGHDELRVGFLIELGLVLNAGHYLDEEKVTEGILKLNGCETIGELLVGESARFGRW